MIPDPAKRLTLEQTKSLISRLIQKAASPMGRFKRHVEEEEEMEWEEQSCPVPDDAGDEDEGEDDRLIQFIRNNRNYFFPVSRISQEQYCKRAKDD